MNGAGSTKTQMGGVRGNDVLSTISAPRENRNLRNLVQWSNQ
jgi:hypothetical protein